MPKEQKEEKREKKKKRTEQANKWVKEKEENTIHLLAKNTFEHSKATISSQ